MESQKKKVFSVIWIVLAAILALSGGFAIAALVKGGKTAKVDLTNPPPVRNQANPIEVAQNSFFPDDRSLIEKLDYMLYGQQEGLLTNDTLQSEIEQVMRLLYELGYYYDYIDNTTVTIGGKEYGAKKDAAGNPIGGGEGYAEIYLEDGEHAVKLVYDETFFYKLCVEAEKGDIIYVPDYMEIDISDMRYTDYPDFILPEGVILASSRGLNGSLGGVLKLSDRQNHMMMASDNVRITGIVLEGPESGRGSVLEPTKGSGIVISGKNVEIDNCEIAGFPLAAIVVQEGAEAHIHHNYIHHTEGKDAGIGVDIAGGKARVESNLFSNTNTAVRLQGEAESELDLSHNVETGTGKVFVSVPEGKGGVSSLRIYNNTVLGWTEPYRVLSSILKLEIYDNVFGLPRPAADALVRGGSGTQYTLKDNVFNLEAPALADIVLK